MKNLFLLLSCCLFSVSIFAQRDETVFGKSGLRLTGAWGGPVLNMTSFGNDFFAVSGGYGGLEFNKNFFIGWGGFETNNDLNIEIDGIVVPSFYLDYHGLMLGYAPFAQKAIHPKVMALVGPGRNYIRNEGNDDLFVIQPSLGFEVNIFQWARIGVEGGYRFIQGSDSSSLSNEDLSSAFGEIKFKFGWSWGRSNKKKQYDEINRFDD